ncbi:MAG TPA: hypothetical protein VGH87_12555 [Polyangiaceae bacterium]|jgi:hypothetical protein
MNNATRWFAVGALAATGVLAFACGGGNSEGGGNTTPSATASTPATATSSAAPVASAAPTQTAAPAPPPIVVIAMKLTGPKMLKGAVEVKEDGSVLGPDGKPVAKFVGAELQDKDGKMIISVAADGTMKIAGSQHGTKFDDKDDLVVEGGAKFHVADDGAVMLFNEDGKADKDSGKLKITGFKPQGRRAATVLVMGMLTPANASSAQISATANATTAPKK